MRIREVDEEPLEADRLQRDDIAERVRPDHTLVHVGLDLRTPGEVVFARLHNGPGRSGAIATTL